MIHYDDLTEAELAVRKLLDRPKWEFESKVDTPFRRWAREAREAWARTPAGQRAIAECELKRGKVRRRVRVEEAPSAAKPSGTSSSRGG